MTAEEAEKDMQITLEDAQFFCEKIDTLVRGTEHEQDLKAIRRYFRAYLHCWKCISYYVREAKGLKNDTEWIEWVERWQQLWQRPEHAEVWESLRNTRDEDTHNKAICVHREFMGPTPLVMFQPAKAPGPPRELISCCRQGLDLAGWLIRDWQKI